jgi:Holliday junction resolvase RusA-like endonuclease
MEPYSSDFPIKRPFWLTINAFYAVGSYNNTPYVSSFDVDNVAKAVADNMQAMKIIADDKWMVGLSVTKQLSAEDYTIIRIYGVEDNGYYAAPLSGRSNK